MIGEIIEVGGDFYTKVEIDGAWMRVNRYGGVCDYATERETRLLDEIVQLMTTIKKAQIGGG